MNKFLLSVVIPSYNEMANLRKGTLEKLKNYLDKQKDKCSYEVIIVDDGSNDGSREFVEKFVKENNGFKLVKNSHTGKAGAVTAGVLSSKGDYVLFTDMDQATPIEELDKFFPAIEEGYDIVIGSRSSRRKGSPLTRIIMSKGIIVLRTILVGLPKVKDTQCGFKMFSKSAAKKIFSKVKDIHQGYSQIKGSSVTAGFDIELLYLGEKFGYKTREIPVDWLYVETRRVSPIKDSIEGVLDLVKIKLNIINGTYK
ncbi:glycosyltransferase family 2 protein [Candidatus Parcubacteria bacterium]|nr:MAG: glycosyltransferase family 2 protein [Candidatus Parcubacteria bacterium]